MDETKNASLIDTMSNSFNSMSSFIDSMNAKEQSIKTATAQREQQERINNSANFYENSYNPQTAVEARNEQHIASRWTKLAAMISQYWSDNWVPVTGTDADVINNYIWNLNPEVRDYVAQRFYNYTHSTEYQEDSNEFALEMWWRKNEWYDDVWEWIKWLGSYLWGWFDSFWRFTKQLNDASTSTSAWEQRSKDIMNLAEERYWTLALSIPWYMDDEKWNDLQWEMDNNPEQLAKQSNPVNIWLTWAEWAVATAVKMNPIFALVDLWIWVLSQLPVTWDILWWADEKAWTIWHYIAASNIISREFREALTTEEAKVEYDRFLWNMIIWLLVSRLASWKKWKSWNEKISPSEAKKMIQEWATDKTIIEANKEFEKLMAKRDMEAAKTIDPEHAYENKQAWDALSQIDPEILKKNKTFADMENTMEKEIKYDVAQQDALLDTLDDRFSTETELSRPLEWRWRTSDIRRKPIKKWFKTMRDWVKFQFDEEALDILKRDADEWKLSTKDVKNMERAMSRQFDIWKDWASSEQIAEWKAALEAIRQELNELVKQSAAWKWWDLDVWNIIEYYDKKMSPKIKLRNEYRSQKDKVNRAKAAFADKTYINILFSKLKNFTSKWKIAQTIINELWWEDVMNALRREKNLPKALKNFLKLDEKLWESKTAREKARVVEEWIKEYWDYVNRDIPESYWWFVEWEVIEPDWATANKSQNPYLNELLESVHVERPESFMIWEDSSRAWVNPVDYTNKTRVTPEWNAARPNQTLEQTKWEYREWVSNRPEVTIEPTVTQIDAWKNNLRKMWFTEKWIEQTINELKKAWIIKQESLFWEWDVGWWKHTDFLWRDKSK